MLNHCCRGRHRGICLSAHLSRKVTHLSCSCIGHSVWHAVSLCLTCAGQRLMNEWWPKPVICGQLWQGGLRSSDLVGSDKVNSQHLTCIILVVLRMQAMRPVKRNFNPSERKADGGFIEYLRVRGRVACSCATCIRVFKHKYCSALLLPTILLLLHMR